MWDAVWTAGAHSGGILEVVGSGGFALAVLGACLLLCRTFAVWIVLPLRAVGSMPLSAYAGQILVWAAVARRSWVRPSRLFAFRDLDPFPAFALGTIGACTLWALARRTRSSRVGDRRPHPLHGARRRVGAATSRADRLER